jgi:hypothetical protein
MAAFATLRPDHACQAGSPSQVRTDAQPAGVVSVEDGPEQPVYQCDECLVMGEVLGVQMETALTFCIDERGRAFNPAAPDHPLFPEPSDN